MTLVEFLLARIAEDQLTAQMAIQTRRPEWMLVEDLADGVDRVVEAGGMLICSPSEQEMSDHIVRWDPARVLAECVAKRAIIEIHAGHIRAVSEGLSAPTRAACQALAQPYADHPDFDPAWDTT